MGKLKSLSYVDFSFNNFSGSMPNFQWSHNLAYIDFSGNALTGPLSFNHFKGLSEIVYINLGSNFLSGRIPPSLFSLPSLQKLLLSNNSFDQVDAYLTASPASQLDTLDLSFNNIKGSIPKYFFDLSNLKVLTLSSNSFGGSIQFNNLHSLPNLTRLELSRNNLSVDVSGSASSSFPQITTLTMASCRLKKFPDLRNQSRLMHLDLSDNEIRGKVPYWIWDVGNGRLSHLNLSYNFLEDLEKPYTIPRNLYLLDLQHNQLQGQLPMMPGSSIIYLDYSHNRFNGSIPIDIGNINIVFLSLSNNSFMGRIPISICNASYLLVLDLSHNKLSGPLPSCLLGTIGTLGVLNLRDNQIIGNIPDSFPSDCALKTLDLSENFLQGRIPKSLVNCSSLEVLNIGKNKIVDTFPCQLKNISSLQVLLLRSNGFHGHLHCVDNANLTWPSFQLFDIADNHFNGKLPSNFFLSLEGMIGSQNPVNSGSHISFKYLRLSKWYYESRVMVTMKANEIELVKILKIFTYLDFSSNNFDRIIPSTIGALDSLYVLNLSHNSLTGNIPKTIGDLKTIESLDLSGNELHGSIPPELGNLTFLSYLNLSHNRLSGAVPAGDQLNTFDEKSYLGNPGLCGLPLLNSCESPPVSRGDESEREADYGEAEMDWEPTALGFLLGLGVYLWMLFRNKRCWEAYEQLDEVLGRLFSQRKVRRLSPGR
ncbi:unnamed protein product [Cuscuta epithymum]|uniref:Uncharacterized protein n=1 Tax=Cuscuta epithymum TaxID=186058 RepID=A0AAV0GGA2_9ASTE|nr:unnamed protein product [Cuscuta epithymum]